MSDPITFSGPHDAIKAGIATSGRDPVYFAAEAPNPRYNPDEYYTIRGVKKWWEKPTKQVAYVHIDLDSDGKSYFVGQAWTDEGFRRQGLIRRLYDMAWDYARSKGKGFQSGWVKSPLMAQYWEGMASQGRAEAYTDEWTRFNTTGKGWRRIKSGGAKDPCLQTRQGVAWITPEGHWVPIPAGVGHWTWAAYQTFRSPRLTRQYITSPDLAAQLDLVGRGEPPAHLPPVPTLIIKRGYQKDPRVVRLLSNWNIAPGPIDPDVDVWRVESSIEDMGLNGIVSIKPVSAKNPEYARYTDLVGELSPGKGVFSSIAEDIEPGMLRDGWVRVANVWNLSYGSPTVAAMDEWCRRMMKCLTPGSDVEGLRVYLDHKGQVPLVELVERSCSRAVVDKFWNHLSGVKLASRTAWAGGACNPNALSTAWITPDGDVIPVPPRQTHSEWANNHFADDEGYLEQRHSAPRYLTDTLGWVRLVNAYTVETGPRGASDRAMQAVVGILVDCVIARRDIDPETDTVTLGIGSSTRRPTIADFVAEFGTRQQSDALYEGLLSRQWGRTAASRPKYQGKKEVPKADGSGTTTVYQYGPRQVANRHRDKAERIEGLRKSIGDLRKRVKSDLKSDDAETRLTALGVALIDATYERVGNDESAGNGHYGVTGWTMDHVTLSKDGKRATFRYTGKSGVDHEKTVRDPDIVAAIRACCSDKGDDDHVLSDGDVRVTSRMVNDYLREFDVTAKDLRGFHANREVQERLRAIRRDGPDLPRPRKERDAILKREFKEALEAAAKAVGHEPSTLRNQYLVPWLEDAYMKDGTVIDRLDKRAARPPVDPRTATKTEAEREDDEATRLVRKTPKLKPSRDDSKRERMRVSDPDTSGRDRDLSLNYKDNG